MMTMKKKTKQLEEGQCLFIGITFLYYKLKIIFFRVKALVSMLTPRNHSLVHPPAFVEFDLSIEGFACLFIPSISNVFFPSTNNLNLSSTNERIFPPLNGFTFMTFVFFLI